jgi:hypothetical protein
MAKPPLPTTLGLSAMPSDIRLIQRHLAGAKAGGVGGFLPALHRTAGRHRHADAGFFVRGKISRRPLCHRHHPRHRPGLACLTGLAPPSTAPKCICSPMRAPNCGILCRANSKLRSPAGTSRLSLRGHPHRPPRRAGTKVTIGVDGSAAKDSGHLLGEVRIAGGRFVDLDLDSLIADTPQGRGAVTRLCDFLAKGRRGAGNKRLHVRRRSGDIAGSHAKLPLQSWHPGCPSRRA